MIFKKWFENSEIDFHWWEAFEECWNDSQKVEREECAKIADKYFRNMVSRVIAEEIRSRET